MSHDTRHTHDSPASTQRRNLLKLGATGSFLLSGAAAAQHLPAPTPTDTGSVQDGRVVFPAWRDDADAPDAALPAPVPPAQRVGFAIVGLGRLALGEILPAFAQSGQARPVALVSGSPDKMAVVARQYGIPRESCYSYDDFERLRDNPAVQAVYIVLPNALHRPFVERAAAIGKHVLCEKPMTTTPADARAMIAACAKAGVKLMVAYRIQYEPHHLRTREFVARNTFGGLVAFGAGNVQTSRPSAAEQWRNKRAMAGGGALFDIGLYCLNTARFVSGQEPVAVYAQVYSPPGDARFVEVEQTVDFTLRFPSGMVAQCMASYGAREDRWQRMQMETSTLEIANAYDYEGLGLVVGRRRDADKTQEALRLPQKNQFAAELDHFADCVRTGAQPRTPGEEGLRDQIIMEAIYRSAQTGRPVALAAAG